MAGGESVRPVHGCPGRRLFVPWLVSDGSSRVIGYDGPRPCQVRFATIRRRTWSRLAVMAIHPDLLEILACPVCKTPVELVREGAGLECAQCKRVYPVRDDIPIMLPEEATIEE